MKIYKVGGCIRDRLLGRTNNPQGDIDYVVVGASTEEFLKEHPGAKCIGRGLPVYLYKGDEYAFARTEASTGQKHNQFEVATGPGVTLLQDLERRDLTVNAIAENPETGRFVCSDQSWDDLRSKTLRHINPSAFVEDPLRVFRVARFACELEGFTVAPETIDLMRTMDKSLETLSPERVFKELEKALKTDHHHRFFNILMACGCLDYWFPEILACIAVPAGHPKKHGAEGVYEHLLKASKRVPKRHPHLKYAVLCHDLGKALTPPPEWPKHHGHDKGGIDPIANLSERLRVPKDYQKAALMFCHDHIRSHRLSEMRPGKAVRFLLNTEKHFPGGIIGFMSCAIGDGFDRGEARRIIEITWALSNVKLPKKYWGRKGLACGQILLNLQCQEYKEVQKLW